MPTAPNLQGPALYLTLGLVALIMATVYLLPKLTLALPWALATLIGVRFTVVVGTFAWSSL